jgi:hypothetical protein
MCEWLYHTKEGSAMLKGMLKAAVVAIIGEMIR